jgi:hypothetical protein
MTKKTGRTFAETVAELKAKSYDDQKRKQEESAENQTPIDLPSKRKLNNSNKCQTKPGKRSR